jgi:hypothetical protein
MTLVSRRDALKLGSALLAGATAPRPVNADETVKPRPVAGVVTIYGKNSHADVLLTKILEGWKHDGGPGPALKLASLYVDQFPNADLARKMCKKRDVPIFDSIEKAVTVGGKSIPVDGVISIGEHGDYPTNKLGQKLHPRKRFFEEITDTFAKYDRVVPVFSDKHLGPAWADAKWMYDRARKLKVPFMAGSSLPVSFRTHKVAVPLGSEIEFVVGIGYDGLDIYGSHALDCYQWFAERRKSAETGVKRVQYLEGPAVWKAVDDGLVAKDVLQAAFDVVAKPDVKDMRAAEDSALFLFEHADGFRGAQFMMQNVVRTAVGVKLKGQKPAATGFEDVPAQGHRDHDPHRPPELPRRANTTDERHPRPGADVAVEEVGEARHARTGDRVQAD